MNSVEESEQVYARSTGARLDRVFVAGAVVLCGWLLCWIWLSWPYTLDDALIHLRYADHLLHQHRITYDGVHPSFGTSSLLYVAVLAAIRTVSTSPLVPRVLSSVVYAGFFAGVVGCLYTGLHASKRLPGAVWLMALLLVTVFVTPSAVRWMDDGMETGLVFCAALAGVVLLRRTLAGQGGAAFQAMLFVYGLLTVLLRVELLLLVGCLSAMAVLPVVWARADRASSARSTRDAVSALLPIVGGLAAAALIFAAMHSLLPDTAVAKAFGAAKWDETFSMTAITVASSFSFGVGLMLVWLASIAGLAIFARVAVVDVLPSLLFPVVLLASAMRGQQIQGIRYFGWTLFVPALWNLLRIADQPERPAPRWDLAFKAVFALLFVALLPSVVWESRTFYRIFQGRGSALNAFRAQHLEGLKDRLGIAEDVGFVGYFTQGQICDPYGLVNGRAAARLNYDQRLSRCMDLHPEFAFGSEGFLHRVALAQSLQGWAVCGTYRFDNVRTKDVHLLIVAPALVAASCPETAKPLAATVPGVRSSLPTLTNHP